MDNIIKQVQEACAEICEQYTYAENAAALIRAIDLSHLTGWQDISTAPKDGTVILAYYKSPWVVDVSSMSYVHDNWYWDYFGEIPSEPPTHWMPLPPAPKDK